MKLGPFGIVKKLNNSLIEKLSSVVLTDYLCCEDD